MEKRIWIIILSMFLVLGLVGCGSSVAKNAINQGKEELQKKEYNKALALFEIALDNDDENEEIDVLKNIINDYIIAKEYLEEGKIEESQKTIDGINSQYSEYSIKDDINSLKNQIDEDMKTNEAINNDIKKLTALYDEKEYDDAIKMVSELNIKKLNDKQEKEINNINEKIEAELKIIEDEKKGKLKKIEEMKKAKRENPKQFFTDKLDNIEIGLDDLKELYSGTTAEMMAASIEEYNRWDEALNEIYDALKSQLSASDMSKLKEEQIQWISDKEKKAEEDGAQFKGGTLEPVIYTSSLAGTTKDRCYELVEQYMK